MELHQDIDQAGIKNEDRFEAMLERPKFVSYGEEVYPSFPEKAACYFHSIARGGHIFHNGNKRTALLVLETFLNINGFELTLDNQKAEDFTVEVATHPKYKGNDCIKYLAIELDKYMVLEGTTDF